MATEGVDDDVGMRAAALAPDSPGPRGAATYGWIRLVLAGFILLGRAAAASATPPSIVYLLLDTTRADRLGAWGNPRPTSPTLDRLAGDGIRFARHFASSHATRQSMPQLMSGRYYHLNILRAFKPDEQPAEFPWNRPDPTAVLLPEVLHREGFQLLAASAHTWVTRDSPFGTPFDEFVLEQAPPERGHADAKVLVDRAIALWTGRDRTRPTFLYVHFMDAHMPRYLPAGDTRFLDPAYDWRARFRPDGEPAFDRDARRWDRAYAGDFTPQDQAHFAAVYDTLLASMDAQIARLLERVRADDPGLRSTLVVVTADHGEELGEDGRTDHEDSLADGVQHIPWIMTGAGLPSGRVVDHVTEHVDVVPTVLTAAGLGLPDGAIVDGRPQLERDGSPCSACAKHAAYYAWEDYSAIRTGRLLLRRELSDSLRARCVGAEQLYRMSPDHRTRVPLTESTKVGRLGAGLTARLAGRRQRYVSNRLARPTASMIVRSPYWHVDPATPLACDPVGPTTGRTALLEADGWLWSGRGVALTTDDTTQPFVADVTAADGPYDVSAAVVPMERMPWLFGFDKWKRRVFREEEPLAIVPLGRISAAGGRLRASLAPAAGTARHVVGLRLTPPDATAAPSPMAPMDESQRQRLRALGYID